MPDTTLSTLAGHRITLRPGHHYPILLAYQHGPLDIAIGLLADDAELIAQHLAAAAQASLLPPRSVDPREARAPGFYRYHHHLDLQCPVLACIVSLVEISAGAEKDGIHLWLCPNTVKVPESRQTNGNLRPATAKALATALRSAADQWRALTAPGASETRVEPIESDWPGEISAIAEGIRRRNAAAAAVAAAAAISTHSNGGW